MVSPEWDKLPLGSVVTLQRGFDLPSRLRKKGVVPIVSSSGINGYHDCAPVGGPGVVTGRYGTIGEVFYVNDDFWPLNTTLYVVDFKGNNPLFTSYLLKTVDFKSYSGKSGVPGVNRNDLHEHFVHLPPTIKEQQTIAEALSDVDALIDGLEKLIAKKRDIKTATMQQLLTGKTRLPGFGEGKGFKQTELGEIPEDWEVLSLDETISNIIDYRGRTPKKIGMEWGGGDIVALSAANVKMGFIDFNEECYLGSIALYNKWMQNGTPKKGDLLLTMEAPLGNIALIPDDREYILSQRTILLQFSHDTIVNEFAFHQFCSASFQQCLRDNSTGSTAQGIKRTRLEKLALLVPTIAEQQAIAEVLSDMDKELEALQTRLSKTKSIKQGMMQELLTGKTRLV